jgi:hypothetical protein
LLIIKYCVTIVALDRIISIPATPVLTGQLLNQRIIS